MTIVSEWIVMDGSNQQIHEINMENAIIEIIENNLNQMSVDDSNLSAERRYTKKLNSIGRELMTEELKGCWRLNDACINLHNIQVYSKHVQM